METNIIVAILTFGLIIYMIYNRFNMFMDHKKALDEINHRGDFKKMFTGWLTLSLYILTFVLSTSWLVVMLLNKDAYNENEFLVWVLVLAVFMVTSASDIVKNSVLHTTYYNDQGIFHNQTFFRYNSVKNFKVKFGGLATEVILFNGQAHSIPTKALQKLEDRIVKVQAEEKINKTKKSK